MEIINTQHPPLTLPKACVLRHQLVQVCQAKQVSGPIAEDIAFFGSNSDVTCRPPIHDIHPMCRCYQSRRMWCQSVRATNRSAEHNVYYGPPSFTGFII